MKNLFTRQLLDQVSYPAMGLLIALWMLILILPFVPLKIFRMTVAPGAPNVWWTWREFGDHWVVHIAIGVLFLGTYLMNSHRGLRVMGDWIIYLVVANNMWTFVYYLVSGNFQYGYWFQMIFAALTLAVVFKGRPFKPALLQIGTFTLLLLVYLCIWWGLYNFPITSALAMNPQNADPVTNLLEIGYWSFATSAFLFSEKLY